MFPRSRHLFLDDRGMVTSEYAVGMIVAVALVAVLYLVVQSGSVEEGLTRLIERALDFHG
jgi:hypothetical protein